jgi:hypothetical protein
MCHPSLLLRQSVESLESVLQISQSSQFPQELLCAPFCEDLYHTQPVKNLLADPRFISFVAIPKILRISTIICVIMSVIAVVGDKVVYVSSREKKYPMRSKSSARTSLLAAMPCAAYKIYNVRRIRSKSIWLLAERRTPTPAKITLAGENAYQRYVRGCLKPRT